MMNLYGYLDLSAKARKMAAAEEAGENAQFGMILTIWED